jgi:hypothetical protein
VKLGLIVSLLLVGCNSCQPAASPEQAIYLELVDAGCLAATDGGPAAIARERALGDASPAWLTCLYGGWNVAGCQVPCQ